MALTTYSGLQAGLARLLRRSDLTSDITDWIALAEAQINRRLRVAAMVGRTTISVNAEYVDAPTDFAGVRTLDINTNPITQMQFVTPDEMTKLRATVHMSAGVPTHYSIVGSQFRFSPAPGATYTGDLTYWQTIPALSDSNASNWLLTKHPDVYLYGSALQSAPFLRADDRLPMWAQLFTQGLADVEADDHRASFGGAPSMRVRRIG